MDEQKSMTLDEAIRDALAWDAARTCPPDVVARFLERVRSTLEDEVLVSFEGSCEDEEEVV